MTRYSFFTILWGLLLTACIRVGTPTPAFSPTPTESTPPPSPTIVWFPPSATPTLTVFTTPTATPEMRPNIGENLLQDDFSQPALWSTSSSPQGSISIANNGLTIAAQPGTYLFSLRSEPIIDNFYAELTANLALCRGNGEYGILLRATATSYYRIGLICDGSLRIDRVNNGTRYPLQPPIFSSDVPRGAPARVRIGVWLMGAEMRLFLNDQYQLTLTDKTFSRGSVGVFARAPADLPLTVTFSNLTIHGIGNQTTLIIPTQPTPSDLFLPYCDQLPPKNLPPEKAGKYQGWQRYTHPQYGFSLAIPPQWVLGIGQHFLCLAPQAAPTIHLVIGFKRNTETVTIQRTGVGAGDILNQGTVNFLGQPISRDVLIYQEKEKAILYHLATEIQVDDLIFTLSLDDFRSDYEAVSLPTSVQEIADQIVESFQWAGK